MVICPQGLFNWSLIHILPLHRQIVWHSWYITSLGNPAQLYILYHIPTKIAALCGLCICCAGFPCELHIEEAIPRVHRVNIYSATSSCLFSMKQLICIYWLLLYSSDCTALQLQVEYMQVLVSHRASGVKALSDDFDWGPGFWLHDAGNARECCSRVQADCEVWTHSREVWNEIRSGSVPLGTVECK
jgi:hypothetical protein